MSAVHPAPPFRFSKPLASVGGRSDTVNLTAPGEGIHNRGAGGMVKITYWLPGSTTDREDTLYINQGDFILAPVKRVWATGTDVAEADLSILY